MARVTLVKDLQPPENFFYNVDAAVGPGCPNRRDDVFLVQYFLKVAYDNANAFQPPLVPPPGEPMRVDGVAGPTTFRWIKHFQEEGRRRANPIAVDGQIDRAKGSGFGSLSSTQYTIGFLSNAYRHVRPLDFKNIAKAADCPPELASAVSLI